MFIRAPTFLSKLARYRNLGADESGAAAVEFALVGLPFLALIGAIFQIALQIWAAQNFDRALQIATRAIFTGQFQAANAGQTTPAALLAALKANMCGTASPIVSVFNCQGVKIDVATASSFANATASTPINTSTGTWNTNFGTNYACAAPGTVVIVTAAVQYPSFLNLLGLNTKSFTSGPGTGSHLLMSTAVFRTEPYGTSPC